MVLLSLIGICLAAGTAGAAPFVVKINFQLASAQVPDGYVADSGLAFGDRGNGYTYGWSRDISADSRDRNNAHADQRYDTLLHLQKGAAAVWEIVVPNGEYNLYWVSGDPTATDQTNSFDVEGVAVPDPDGQGGGDNFDEFTVTVTVADGRLTIKPGTGATNSKICFIDITQALPPDQAMEPKPADKATDVPRDMVLAWTAAPSAAKHNVYVGTNFDDVNNATVAGAVSTDQTATTYEPANVFAYGQTYYWRVDEVNGVDSKVSKGEIWSFTVEPYAYPIENVTATASSAQPGMAPANTVNGAGLNAQDQHSVEGTQMWLSSGAQPNWIQFEFDQAHKLQEMWVWNSNQLIEAFIGFGAKDVKVEHSLDGSVWTELAGVPEFAKATAAATYTHNTTVDFGGAVAKYVKLTINSSWGGMPSTGLSEVRFFSIPVQAREPVPAVDGTGVELDATLAWRPGREAASHKVYFGTDMDAVTAGTAAAQTVVDHSFTPAAMDFGTAYYWRVDEVNEAMTPSTYEGSIWSFTTQEFTAIDDFEGYTDADDGTRIYETWIDGVTTGASGSTVGYMEAPFAEQKVVHDGKQSMPLAYDNSQAPFFSEAEREFDSPQNWTGSGASELCVWTQGYPAPAAVAVTETAGKMTLTGAGVDIWGNYDEFTYAYKTLNGDGSIIARVTSTGTGANTWAKGGVMIRDSLKGGSTHAMMVITGGGGNGASFQYRPVADAASSNADSTAAIAPPYWVKIERQGDTFIGSFSADGKTWSQVGQTTITMEAPVQIGLCVTSHVAGVDRTFQFDNISATGGVSGSWQGAVINSPQFNDPADMYLVVTDSAGKTATATSATAVGAADWTRWVIPMSSLKGVNLAKVTKLTLGVGNKTAPTAGGTGMVFVDDIGYGKAAAGQ